MSDYDGLTQHSASLNDNKGDVFLYNGLQVKVCSLKKVLAGCLHTSPGDT